MAFDRFAVVRVPFTFTDRQAAKNRPALVLSTTLFGNAVGHSVVRYKLFTLDHRLVRGVLGRLAPEDAAQVEANLKRLLGLA